MTGTDALNVIIQAGGHGTRMGQLTANKPKALIPLRGKPLLFHTLDLFPHSDIVVIGDYKIDVLRQYCEAFGRHEHLRIVRADGSGTCAGISEAAKQLDSNAPVMLTWCDLIFSDSPAPLFAGLDRAAVGLSTSFPCRWSLRDGRPVHAPSSTEGIAGCFWFPRTSFLNLTPSSGEFCEYLGSCSGLDTLGVPLGDLCAEVGTLDAYERQTAEGFASRPFNRITALPDGTLLKEPVDAQGESLAKLEQAWYRQASRAGLDCVPAILGYEPLRMEMIQGTEPYRLSSSSSNLKMIIRGLCQLHEAFPTVPADTASLDQAYLGKTAERLEKVARLIPMADSPEIVINGKTRRNPLHHWDELGDAVRRHYPQAFCFIHGDPTFSNMLVSGDRVVFIDPRGYFGTTKLLGDPAYDWAKLLYSLLTNYDQFNLGRFRLSIASQAVDLEIQSSGWEHLATDVFNACRIPKPYLMSVLGIIWLSLTTYAWDDYDKVCGSFYKGTEVLSSLWD
jgi:GTP:adenosylcobinamide-phosphate guanylyltransferase